jgi:hypothetical protein
MMDDQNAVPNGQISESSPRAAGSRDGSGWTIPILCLGLAIIAACVVIPQADANRRLFYEREKLTRELDQIQRQASVNEEFLKKLDTDPQLAQRLAERQMRVVPAGEKELMLKTTEPDQPSSPFLLVHIPPPEPLPPYESVGGVLSDLCAGEHSRLYLMGAGMFMVAMGLVLGDKIAEKTVHQ